MKSTATAKTTTGEGNIMKSATLAIPTVATRHPLETLAHNALVGRKIIAVSYLTVEEARGMGWTRRPLVITLDDGTNVFSSCDDEGNDGGALFTDHPTWTGAPVLRA
jgi:hypothetical protein